MHFNLLHSRIRGNSWITALLALFLLGLGCQKPSHTPENKRPNILFCIADDWSFPHAGVYGTPEIRTPHFDSLASAGLLFNNSFTAASSCSPSRAAILTGQDIYRLRAGGCLYGTLPREFPIYTDLLEEVGYSVGFTGKGYGPADLSLEDWEHNPAGHPYQDHKLQTPESINNTDYARNFASFLDGLEGDQPFAFWYGAFEPHRGYKYGIGEEHGLSLDNIRVPGFLPDCPETRNDVADYFREVEWFDQHLGSMITMLRERGDLDNTLIVVTSDNGMPFPRAKTTNYNYGVQMPLAISWGGIVDPGRQVDIPVSHIDLAPTFLEMGGVRIPPEMTGISLLPFLINDRQEGERRNFAVSALERHTLARRGKLGYPIRAIHTEEYTYIYNFEPHRWPAGDPDLNTWPQGYYGDIDDGASKRVMEKNADRWPDLFELSFGKRPQEELYWSGDDRENLINLADRAQFAIPKANLKADLFKYLRSTKDPRLSGDSPWDDYIYSGRSTWETEE